MKRISGGQLSREAKATLLSSHAGGPRTAAGDKTFVGQTKAADAVVKSQPAASPKDLPVGSDVRRRRSTLAVTVVRCGCSRSLVVVESSCDPTTAGDPAYAGWHLHARGAARREPTMALRLPQEREPRSRRLFWRVGGLLPARAGHLHRAADGESATAHRKHLGWQSPPADFCLGHERCCLPIDTRLLSRRLSRSRLFLSIASSDG